MLAPAEREGGNHVLRARLTETDEAAWTAEGVVVRMLSCPHHTHLKVKGPWRLPDSGLHLLLQHFAHRPGVAKFTRSPPTSLAHLYLGNPFMLQNPTRHHPFCGIVPNPTACSLIRSLFSQPACPLASCFHTWILWGLQTLDHMMCLFTNGTPEPHSQEGGLGFCRLNLCPR